MEQKKDPKKVFLQLEREITFTCFQEELGCLYKDGGSDFKACIKAPCPLNLFKFGTHERILDMYLNDENWDDAYFYFQDLLPQFSIDCDVKELEKIKKKNIIFKTEDLPPGCRVFKLSDELRKIKNNLKIYKKLNFDEISEKGKNNYTEDKIKFRKKLFANLEILKHLAIDKRQQNREDLLEKKYKILIVKTQMGDLRPEAMEIPIHKDVEDVLKDKKKKKNNNIPGF